MSPPQAASVNARALQVLWPAFLLAGVLELLVFALVDPVDLRWPGGASIELPRQAIYSAAFFVFWAVIALACTITAQLTRSASEVNAGERF